MLLLPIPSGKGSKTKCAYKAIQLATVKSIPNIREHTCTQVCSYGRTKLKCLRTIIVVNRLRISTTSTFLKHSKQQSCIFMQTSGIVPLNSLLLQLTLFISNFIFV